MSEEMSNVHLDRILVVDDTAANLQLLTNLLTEHGYTVHPASDGELALQFVQSIQPDIILLDIKMPGMDGYEVCRRLKADARTRSIPIIFISIIEDEQDKVKGFQAGAVDYITKPFRPEEVLARLRTHLHLRELTEHLEQKVSERTEELQAANAQLQHELAERKQAELALQQSETLLNISQRLAKIGGWDWDVEQQISFWTEETYRIHGFEPQAFMQVSSENIDRILACYDPADRPVISSAFQRCGQQGDGYDMELPFTSADGCRKWIRTTATAVREEGRVVKVVGNFMDITKRKQAEEALHQLNIELDRRVLERTAELKTSNVNLEKAYRDLQTAHSQMLQQEKMASIGQLAAGVAHEINNPLAFIISNLGTFGEYSQELTQFHQALEASLRSLTAAAPGSDALVEINRLREAMDIDFVLEDMEQIVAESLDGGNRMKKIVENLKSFARLDEAEYKMADLNQGLETTLNIVWNELKYKAKVNQSYGDLPQTVCNPGQLNQVFMNLLVNAAQAIEGQGEIDITTHKTGDTIVIEIADTGCGISVDDLDRIFEPFFTTKEVGKGTGLGLSIVYDIVAKHGGEIAVDSRPGRGTRFTISLPVRSA